MTISSETVKSTTFTGDGSTTAFASGFKILADPTTGAGEVEVTTLTSGVEAVVSSSSYTVTGVGEDAGGTVTFTTAPASGVSIVIKSKVAKTQGEDLKNQGASFRETYESMIDRAVRMIQEMNETQGRTIKATITGGATNTEVAPSDGRVLGWSGTELANLTPNSSTYLNVTPFAETLLDDTTAASMLTTLGVAAASLTLSNKTIAVGSGNDVQTQMDVVVTTYDLSTASGNKDITGFGFNPRGCLIISGVTTSNAKASVGFAGTSAQAAIYKNSAAGTWSYNAGTTFVMQDSIGVTQVAGGATFITDGVRLAMTKTGSPTGTVGIAVLAWR